MKSAEHGTTFVECVAAIALIATAVLVAASLLAAHPRTSARLDAQQAMLRALEATLEGVRGGLVPLRSGPVEASPDWQPGVWTRAVDGRRRDAGQKRPRVRLEVQVLSPAGLYAVTAVATSAVRGERLEQRLESRVWRPR